MVGHDGWADGRYGDYDRSDVILNDYLKIREFRPMGFADREALRPKNERLIIMQKLAAEAKEDNGTQSHS